MRLRPAGPGPAAQVSSLLDCEGELAVVIGTRCRHVAVNGRTRVIAGDTIANDSVRAPLADGSLTIVG